MNLPEPLFLGEQPGSGQGSAIKQIANPCAQHKEVEAKRRCDRCRALMCTLCRFEFPGNISVCPTCVMSPNLQVSTGRAIRAILGIIISGISLACLGGLMGGMMTFETENQVGLFFTGAIFFPAAIGLTLSYSAMDKNRGNNALLWTASAISSVQLLACMGLIILGLMNS